MRGRDASVVDREELWQFHLRRVVQIEPGNVENLCLEPEVEVVLRLDELTERAVEVLALDVDDCDRAVISLGAESGLFCDPEPLLRAIVVRVPRTLDLAVEVAKRFFLAGLDGHHQTCVIHCLSFVPPTDDPTTLCE